MEDWTQEELERVVREKHGAEKPTNETKIICKFFLDAVEKKQYGWFWKCPNGSECKYRCVRVGVGVHCDRGSDGLTACTHACSWSAQARLCCSPSTAAACPPQCPPESMRLLVCCTCVSTRRHALPPGYVLKSQMKELLEEEASKVRGC
jgi:hypothetical protein